MRNPRVVLACLFALIALGGCYEKTLSARGLGASKYNPGPVYKRENQQMVGPDHPDSRPGPPSRSSPY